MTTIFKPYMAGIERRIQEAAAQQADRIVGALKHATYDNTAGHWNTSYNHDERRRAVWLETKEAFTSALLASAQREIEKFAIDLLKQKAAEWEGKIFPCED